MLITKTFLFNQSINILATLISGYLLYDDLGLFISRPTHSSKSTEKLQPKHIPDFFVCPIPAFDLENLQKHGYLSSYNFLKGTLMINDTRKVGWNGKYRITNESVMDDISVIKSVKDCPIFKVLFKHNFEAIDKMYVSYSLTSPIFPNGRCCKVHLQKNESISPILRVGVKVKLEKNTPLFEGFRLHIISKESSHFLLLNKNGINLKATLNETGIMYYSIKITQDLDLETDPKVICKNYANPDGYRKACISYKKLSCNSNLGAKCPSFS